LRSPFYRSIGVDSNGRVRSPVRAEGITGTTNRFGHVRYGESGCQVVHSLAVRG
jgi:hypothetical protein